MRQLVGGARRLAASPLLCGSVAVMGASVVTSLLGFLFWHTATHHAPAAAVGTASAAIAVATTVALLTTQGLQPALMVRLPRLEPVERHAVTRAATGAAALIGGVISLAAAVVLSALDSRLGGLASPPLALAVAATGSAQAASGVVDVACLSARRARGMTGRNGGFAVAKLLTLCAVVLVARHPSGPLVVDAVVWGWGASGLASAVVALRWLERFDPAPERRRPSLSMLRGWRGLGWHHAAAVAGQLPPAVLPVLAAVRLGSAQAAYLNVTWMVGGICFFVSPAIASALLADGSHEPARLAGRVRLAGMLTLLALVVPVGVLALYGRPVLALFGAAYGREGRWLLIALAVSAIPDAVTNFAVSVYRVRGRVALAAGLNGGMALGSVALTWVLLRPLGIAAAGVAWLVVQGGGSVVVLLDLARLAARRRGDQRMARGGHLDVDVIEALT